MEAEGEGERDREEMGWRWPHSQEGDCAVAVVAEVRENAHPQDLHPRQIFHYSEAGFVAALLNCIPPMRVCM